MTFSLALAARLACSFLAFAFAYAVYRALRTGKAELHGLPVTREQRPVLFGLIILLAAASVAALLVFAFQWPRIMSFEA